MEFFIPILLSLRRNQVLSKLVIKNDLSFKTNIVINLLYAKSKFENSTPIDILIIVVINNYDIDIESVEYVHVNSF